MIYISDFISNKLAGGFWHTTSVSRYDSIMASGFIKVEPDLEENERYGGCPFVRSLGGVSLFDFPFEFNFEEYCAEIPSNSIGEFVPFKRGWGRSMWLRIDADIVSKNIKSGKEIRELWRTTGSTKRFMAQVEGAHLGDIPISAIKDAYIIGEGDSDWKLLRG